MYLRELERLKISRSLKNCKIYFSCFRGKMLGLVCLMTFFFVFVFFFFLSFFFFFFLQGGSSILSVPFIL